MKKKILNKDIQLKRDLEELRSILRHRDEELLRIRRDVHSIGELFPQSNYREDTSLFAKVLELSLYRKRHEGAMEECFQENRRLWHMVRSLTGDKTLELPRHQRYTNGPNGTQIVENGDYDQRFYPF